MRIGAFLFFTPILLTLFFDENLTLPKKEIECEIESFLSDSWAAFLVQPPDAQEVMIEKIPGRLIL